jgi:hypothetical protein
MQCDAVVHFLFQSAACRARGENFRDCFFLSRNSEIRYYNCDNIAHM